MEACRVNAPLPLPRSRTFGSDPLCRLATAGYARQGVVRGRGGEDGQPDQPPLFGLVDGHG